jgi:putative phosphoribosyl transferase
MFQDRKDAGKKLGGLLNLKLKNNDLIILGLPRGGVIVAEEVAKILHAPLDLLCPRKLGAPLNPELALGAVGPSGTLFLFKDLIERLHVSQDYLLKKQSEEIQEAKRRMIVFRPQKPPLSLKGKTAIIVDDGLATGATMRVAILEARQCHAKKVVMAIPVAPNDTFEELKQLADESYCLEIPQDFWAVGQFYSDFDQISDEEVLNIMKNPVN